ncbi:hypothetical protein SAMN04487947_0142 [Halogeometricum rufum]|uniref:Uncharacterized protein n=1 Tax=Halogeometricum rufum TaxID=553469 RepID=A0A1I6FWP3_9EURY|nr:hypothetical protein [Halogeometricum rufum]SFR34306.1 hypothetical protein SAMN04487947_0142 [Halogeometricum rufum]
MSLFQSSSTESENELEQTADDVAQSVETNVEEDVEEAKGSDLFLFGAVASILYSMYQYYVKGDTERALFVGQWPQTILAVAIYLRHRRDDD